MEESERRKAIELLKEMRGENKSEGEKSAENRLNWMYKGPSDLVDREEYLLGKAIDKTFEVLNSGGSSDTIGRTGEQSNVPKRLLEKTGSTEQVDIAKKILEDPLYAIKQKEMEARKKLLNNPVKLKQIKQMLMQRSKQNSAQKHKKKKAKKKSEEELNHLIIKKLKKFSDKEKRKALNKIMQSDTESSSTDSSSSSSGKGNKRHKSNRKRSYSSTEESDSSSSSESSSSSDEDEKTKMSKSKRRKHSENNRKQNKKIRKSSSDSDSPGSSKHKKAEGKDSRRKRHSRKSSDSESESSSDTDRTEKKSFGKNCGKSDSSEKKDEKHSGEKHRKRSHERRDTEKESRRASRRDSSDERNSKKNYGLVILEGSKPHVRTSPIKRHEKPTETKTKYVPPPKAKPLSEKEREKKLKEMMEDAKVRKQDREKNLASHRKKEAEEEAHKQYDEDFMRRQMSHLTSHGTMADRIKSNVNNIQRSKSSMESSFMRK